MQLELSLAIGTLKELELLHLFFFKGAARKDIDGLLSDAVSRRPKLRELMLIQMEYNPTELQDMVEVFFGTLERLHVYFESDAPLDLLGGVKLDLRMNLHE
ncbi:hypothetical protein BG011_009649 [Mortierella polycephala]|uniref:Uncharacterized protein n=1 Tax=Mortierella polycephala TaxID=41804 RepID=A0A9P6QB78_9FUNG|nr:hypothetical protein BG011_009649 [Mortierella polycephala]